MSAEDCVFDINLPAVTQKLTNNLKRQCIALGGDMVIAISFDFVEAYAVGIGIGEFKRFKAVAHGTAVRFIGNNGQ